MAQLRAVYYVVDNQPWSIEDRHYLLRAIFGHDYQVLHSEADRRKSPERDCRSIVMIPPGAELRAGALIKYDVAVLYKQANGVAPVRYATHDGTQISHEVPADRDQMARAYSYACAYAEQYDLNLEDEMRAIYKSHLMQLKREARRESA